jgi:hypothetical protein
VEYLQSDLPEAQFGGSFIFLLGLPPARLQGSPYEDILGFWQGSRRRSPHFPLTKDYIMRKTIITIT